MPINPKLRVCHVIASINRNTGGPAVTSVRLAQTQAQMGVSTTLVTLDYPEHGSQVSTDGIELITLPANHLARRFRGYNPSLQRTLMETTKEHFNIIHNHGLWMFPNWYARQAAMNAAIPLVIKPCGMLESWSLGRSRSKKFLAWRLFERTNLQSAKLFHATSEAEAASIRALGLRQPIAIIPNGMDIPDLACQPNRGLLEARFPELRGRQWLLFLSRIHPKKGIAELIQAWQAIHKQFDDWHLILAGPDLDGYETTLRRMVTDCGLGGCVTFTGMLTGDDKFCALGNADLFVLPTHSENFGIAVAESLAYGCPVITTKAAPWQDLQNHGCGWWIDNDINALSAALVEAIRLPEQERLAMGKRGRQLMEEKYAWKNVAENMTNAYLWSQGAAEKPAYVWDE